MHPGRALRLFVYSYKRNEKGSLEEYKGDLVAKNVKTFCQDHLPRFSRRVSLNHFDLSSTNLEKYPRVILLSTKKDTPVIWRALSGLYYRRFSFYDAEECYKYLFCASNLMIKCSIDFIFNSGSFSFHVGS